jgi:hypothetical protein
MAGPEDAGGAPGTATPPGAARRPLAGLPGDGLGETGGLPASREGSGARRGGSGLTGGGGTSRVGSGCRAMDGDDDGACGVSLPRAS